MSKLDKIGDLKLPSAYALYVESAKRRSQPMKFVSVRWKQPCRACPVRFVGQAHDDALLIVRAAGVCPAHTVVEFCSARQYGPGAIRGTVVRNHQAINVDGVEQVSERDWKNIRFVSDDHQGNKHANSPTVDTRARNARATRRRERNRAEAAEYIFVATRSGS
jgi:hypothetical protein